MWRTWRPSPAWQVRHGMWRVWRPSPECQATGMRRQSRASQKTCEVWAHVRSGYMRGLGTQLPRPHHPPVHPAHRHTATALWPRHLGVLCPSRVPDNSRPITAHGQERRHLKSLRCWVPCKQAGPKTKPASRALPEVEQVTSRLHQGMPSWHKCAPLHACHETLTDTCMPQRGLPERVRASMHAHTIDAKTGQIKLGPHILVYAYVTFVVPADSRLLTD
eukprot:223468-Chlamydomonas_euryale.AAC.2